MLPAVNGPQPFTVLQSYTSANVTLALPISLLTYIRGETAIFTLTQGYIITV